MMTASSMRQRNTFAPTCRAMVRVPLHLDVCAWCSELMPTDSSHDYHHIDRVVGLAMYIFNKSHPSSTSRPVQTLLIILSAFLHDIGDRKYIDPSNPADPATLAETFLLSISCPADLARDVQDIVNHVSYSNEVKHPDAVRAVLQRLPELGIVQDADRLDAIGAVGVGRAFTYAASVRAREIAGRDAAELTTATSSEPVGDGEWDGDARRRALPGQDLEKAEPQQLTCQEEVLPELGSSMNDSIQHFVDKLEKLEGMMKTDVGRELAKERTKRLKEFRGWWEEEADFAYYSTGEDVWQACSP
jgi:uncharacterized protein